MCRAVKQKRFCFWNFFGNSSFCIQIMFWTCKKESGPSFIYMCKGIESFLLENHFQYPWTLFKWNYISGFQNAMFLIINI